MSLTAPERAAMRACAGLLDPQAVRRNFQFVDAADVPLWDSLVERGLARLLGRPAQGYTQSVYALTPKGYEMVRDQ